MVDEGPDDGMTGDGTGAGGPSKPSAKRKVKAKAKVKPKPKPRPRPAGASHSRLVAGAVIAGAIVIAAAIAYIGLDDDGGSESATPAATIDETTTTVERGVDVPFVPAPSTTAAPAQPTTTAASGATTTTARRPAPTTTRPASAGGGSSTPPCGSGSVNAHPGGEEVDDEPPDHATTVFGDVTSAFDRPIEVTQLIVRITFADGSSQDASIDTSGVVVQPGDTHRFPGPTVQSESSPNVFEVAAFAYRTQGRPECLAST